MAFSCNKRQSSTIINLLDPVLKPTISCSALAAEDYPVENLISSDFSKSNRGFIVYLSKPPICLKIDLICPVQLSSIKIWPEIGSLKSTGFDIFILKNGQNEKIASCDELRENSVVFCRLNESSEFPAYSKKCFFFRNLTENTKVDKLMIRIWKTKNSCVPAIKKIEIWGKVNEDDQMSEQVLKLWKSKSLQSKNANYKIPVKSTDQLLQSNVSQEDIEIPEELLDAITHQIMTIPMVLPSGKTVDQSTIEKFNKVESTWGREPSDPFTGLIFTDFRKPLFNPAIKSSIDKFLNKYPDSSELNNVPRTVGTVLGNMKRNATSSFTSLNDSPKKLKYFGSELSGIDISESNKYLTRPTFTQTNMICDKCQSSEELYRIKNCGKHFICRACLFNIDFNKCNGECSCRTVFSQKDVEKYYSSNNAFSHYFS